MEVKDWIIILQWPVVGAIITLLLGPLVRNWVGHGFEKRMESVRSLMAIQYGTTKRMLDLHDEALIIIGETKSIKLALEAGQKRDALWIKEQVYLLERFAQTWWPYYEEHGLQIRDKVHEFRKKLNKACTYDPKSNTTNIDNAVYWEAAEEVQKMMREGLKGPIRNITKSR